MRGALSAALVLLLVAACSGSTATIGGDDTGDGGSGDGGGSGADATLDGSGGGDGSSGGADGASSSGGDGSAGDGGGRVDAQIQIAQIFMNCQPQVPPDPILMNGTLTVHNGTAGNIGPIAIPSGAFLDPGTSTSLATYKFEIVSIPVLGPGASGTANIVKAANSVVPANGCSTLPCGKPVVVEISPSGPGVPAGVHLRTNPIQVGCSN